MAVVGSAQILVRPSFAGFQQTASRQMQSAGTESGKKFGSSFGSSVKGIVRGAAVAIGGLQLARVFQDGVKGASDLAESGSKVNQIFGRDGAKALDAFSKGSARSLGQTKLQILDAAATFGTMGTAAGLSGKDLAKFSTGFASLATDMASFFNTSPAAATEAIGAALRGEAEPIRKYGVLLDDAALKAEAMSLGLLKASKDTDKIKSAQNNAIIAQRNYNTALKEHGKGSDEVLRAEGSLARSRTALDKATTGTIGPLTQQQKILAAQGLIYKQTGAAQGDFARTSGGLANQQRILSAQWAEAKTRLGTALLPAVTSVATAMNKAFGPAVDYVGKTFTRLSGTARALFSRLTGGRGVLSDLRGGFNGFVAAFKYGDGEISSARFPGLMETFGARVRRVFLATRIAVLSFWAATKAKESGPILAAFASIRASLAALRPQVDGNAAGMTALNGVLRVLSVLVHGGVVVLELFARGLAFLARHQDEAQRGAQVLGTGFKRLLDYARSKDWTSLRNAFASIGRSIITLLPAVGDFRARLPGIEAGVRGVSDVLAFMARHVDLARKAVPLLVAAFVAYKTIQVANNLLGRNSVIGFGAQIAATLSLAASNRALAVSQRGVMSATRLATVADNQSTFARTRHTAAILLSNAAGKVARVATLAWTAGQWLLNAALTANPIGIVVVAIAALVAGLVFAYRHSETFRKIVQAALKGVQAAAGALSTFFKARVLPVITGVLTAIGNGAKFLWSKAIKPSVDFIVGGFRLLGNIVRAVWTGFLSPVFQLVGAIVVYLAKKVFAVQVGAIRLLWSGLGALVRGVYNNIIKPTIDFFARRISDFRTGFGLIISALRAGWDLLSSKIRDGYNRLIRPIVDAFSRRVSELRAGIATQIGRIRASWDLVSSKVSDGYNKTIKPALDFLRDKVGGLKTVFETAVTAIGKAWDGLKEIAKAPVKFVINTVINGLIDKFNGLAGVFGTDTISRIDLPPGFARGGWTGPGAKYQLAGVVHADEFVIRKESRRKIEQERPGLLDMLNGYALGGRVKPTRSGRTNPSYPGHSGVDFYGAPGDPIFATATGRVSYAGSGRGYGNAVFQTDSSGLQMVYGHMSRILAQIGQALTAGQLIGRVGYSGNVRPAGPGGAHLHYEVAPGGFARASNRASTFSYLGGAALAPANAPGPDTGFNVLGKLKDLLAGPLNRLKEVGSSPFARLVARVPVLVKDALVNRAKGFVGNLVGGVASKVGGVLGKAKILAVLTTALGLNRLPLTLLDNWYRQVMSESGGNAGITQQITDVNSRSGNRAQGLLQVIPPTFAAYRSRFLPNDPFNSLANAYAAMNYAKSRYSNLDAVIGHGHGYAAGTRSAQRGWATVGERGPELVNFRGGEQVYNQQQLSVMGRGPMEIRGRLDMGHGLEGYIEGIVVEVTDQRDQRAVHRSNLPAGVR